MKTGEKIGIMGGTFNPIHNGHLILAQTAYDQLHLDKVLFIPSGNSYMKRNVLNVCQRIEMVRLAIRQYPYFELSLIEAQRLGNTYTYETLEELTILNPNAKYYFIMGADSLFQIEQWRYSQRIYQLSTLVCAIRQEYHLESIKRQGALLVQKGADILYLDIQKIEISSTDIRKKVKEKLPISEYVPIEVANYIRQEHLYDEEN